MGRRRRPEWEPTSLSHDGDDKGAPANDEDDTSCSDNDRVEHVVDMPEAVSGGDCSPIDDGTRFAPTHASVS